LIFLRKKMSHSRSSNQFASSILVSGSAVAAFIAQQKHTSSQNCVVVLSIVLLILIGLRVLNKRGLA